MMRGWRLNAPGFTLALAARGGGLPWIVWLGPAPPPDEDIAALAPVSLCREAALGFPGHRGLIADAFPAALCGGGALGDGALVWRGRGGAIGYTTRIALPPSGLVALSASVENLGAEALRPDRLAAPAPPLSASSRETVEFLGR